MILLCGRVYAEEKNNNPMLKSIKINGENIKPAFEMFTTEYVMSVDEKVEKVKIEATPDDSKASVKIIGNTNLQLGRNTIEIKVTAENGRSTQSYFLYITRGDEKSSNAYLKELKIKNYDIAPIFNKEVINYAFEYQKNENSFEIEAIPEEQNAKVEIIGNENINNQTKTIQVKVTAKDNQTIKTYYIIAKKSEIVQSQNQDEIYPTEEEPKEEIIPAENTQNENIQNVENKSNNIIWIILSIVGVGILVVIIVMINKKGGKH